MAGEIPAFNLMVFTGIGIVKNHGKVIANFIDGECTVDDVGSIETLKRLGFKEKVEQLKPEKTIKRKEKK